MLPASPKTLTLGILGGGQLGMLLAREARERQLRVHLYIEGAGDHPASAFADQVFEGKGWSDLESIRRFAQSCDRILLENEFVPVELLQQCGPEKFVPNLPAYGIFQDKFQEKTLAREASVAVADFALAPDLATVQALLQQWDKLVLKTCRGGYDGTGNLTVTSATPPEAIETFLGKGACLAERWVEFTHEVAVMVARSHEQEVVFPVAETIQHHHICHQVIAPARFSAELNLTIQQAALRIVRQAEGIGLFGVELFVTAQGELLYNESAPRPHNSAHFTLEGCTLSQFAAHLDIAQGLPLRAPQLRSPSVGMLNLLGTKGGTNQLLPADLFAQNAQGHLWLYGKRESRPGRKLGHYTLLGDNAVVILNELTRLQQRYSL